MNTDRLDVAFRVSGQTLARDHRWDLAQALLKAIPLLATDPLASIHPIKLAPGQGSLGLLSVRSRLSIRISRTLLPTVLAVDGTTLEVGGFNITMLEPQRRELVPHNTLYAHFVDAENADESEFLAAIGNALADMGVRCTLVCGRAQTLRGPNRPLHGYSLMLQGLREAGALRVLETGLGPHRLMGCGLFVPHKSAAAVGTVE